MKILEFVNADIKPQEGRRILLNVEVTRRDGNKRQYLTEGVYTIKCIRMGNTSDDIDEVELWTALSFNEMVGELKYSYINSTLKVISWAYIEG